MLTPGRINAQLQMSSLHTLPVTATEITTGNVLIKGAGGYLCSVLVTTTTTNGQNITFVDNASGSTGTVIGLVAGGTTAGTVVNFYMPANSGITIAQNANLDTGAITVSFI